MISPYPFPSRFSDPFRDWEGSEAEMASILAKAPEDLKKEDYGMIFYQHLPAADYEEGCPYVVPYMEYLEGAAGLEERVEDGFFWYVDFFAARFKQDKILEPLLNRLWDCFLRLTSTFEIVRLTDEELKAHGISHTYREIALMSRTVPCMLGGLTRWPVFDPLLVRLRNHFEQPRSQTHAHWFCELAHHTRSWLYLSMEPADRHQALFDFFHRVERFRSHFSSILGTPSHSGFFEYFRRVSPF